MEKTQIETRILNDVLNYLATRPYAEVAQLIARIVDSMKTEK